VPGSIPGIRPWCGSGIHRLTPPRFTGRLHPT
jgi:hypothetical protein